MKVQVTFAQRTNKTGDPTGYPDDAFMLEIPEGVVLDKTFVERTEPAATHNEEVLEEDDSFLSVGSETWEYDIAEDREAEFVDALQRAKVAMQYKRIDGNEEESTTY